MDTQLVAIPIIFRTYKVANVAAMNALAGMRAGEFCTVDDVGETYRYSGAAWELIVSTLKGIVWKTASTTPLALNDQAASISWTDLDLTSHTSASAKIAMLQIHVMVDSYTDGNITVQLRKNGDTPDINVVINVSKPVAGAHIVDMVKCGLDAGQVLEYSLSITGTAQVDFTIECLGYIE